MLRRADLQLAAAALVMGCSGGSPPLPPPPAISSSAPPPAASASAPPAEDPAVSGSAKVTLSLDRPEHFLGENVLVHWCIESTGGEPFTIEMGGDYRAASRALRFKVTATGEDGADAPDPDPSGFSLGGIGYTRELKAGDRFCESLPLMRYARIDRPGVYTVRASHDLGWGEGRRAPVGQIRVKLSMPSPVEAERVTAEAFALPRDPNRSAGERSSPYADLSTLRYPVYLGPLEARARAGSEEAVSAIGGIPTPEATRSLLALAGGAGAKITLTAARALAMRLPDPALQGELPARPWVNSFDAERAYLVAAAWRPEHAEPVRELGRRLLGSQDAGAMQTGGFMLQCVGEAADLPALIGALDRAVERTATEPRETMVFPPPRGACQELLRTLDALNARGIGVAADPRSAGEIVAYLRAGMRYRAVHPPGWDAVLSRALQHRLAYVREKALDAADPVDDRVAARLPGLLRDRDIDVRIAACRAAERSGRPALLSEVLRILRETDDHSFVNIALNAAAKLGPRRRYLEVLVERLDDPAFAPEALSNLAGLVESTSRSGGGTITPEEARRLRARWTAFLREHGAALDAGERFKPGDPRLTPDLFTPHYRFTGKDGTIWPPPGERPPG